MTFRAFTTLTLLLAAGLMQALVVSDFALGQNPDPRAGMEVFWEKGCIRCHPVLGQGGNVGPDLTRTPSTGDSFQLAAAMWNHAPTMWQRMNQEHLELPTFELQEMQDLFAFLGMTRSFDEPGNAEVGRQLFESKRCGECHAIRGQGGKAGPDLASVADLRNPVAWVAAMWNHAPGMFRELRRKGVSFPLFQGTEMVDLQTYIRMMAGWGPETRSYLSPPSAERGETLFKTKQCVRCHRIAGQGGRLGPDLSRVILPRRYGEIAVVMWNHAPQMNRLATAQSVPYPNFETQELADVLAYLNSLPRTPPGDAASGAAVFEAKGCSGCHAVTADGTSAGPNLTRAQQQLTPVSLARTMWNHGPTMLQLMESSAIPWPSFNNQELADTLAFLKSIQQSDAPSTSSGGRP